VTTSGHVTKMRSHHSITAIVENRMLHTRKPHGSICYTMEVVVDRSFTLRW